MPYAMRDYTFVFFERVPCRCARTGFFPVLCHYECPCIGGDPQAALDEGQKQGR